MRPLARPLGLVLTTAAAAALAAVGVPPATAVPAVAAPAPAAEPSAPTAAVETESLFDDDEGGNADGDDPAIWVDPSDRRRSLVVATVKDAGLRVYDLKGRRVQEIGTVPATATTRGGRFNNVDVVSGTGLGRGLQDLAVVTDRGRDVLRVFAVDGSRPAPLRDVTVADPPLVFSADLAEVEDQNTAYGVATWRDRRTGTVLVAVSRRNRAEVALLKLVRAARGRVSYERIGTLPLPTSFALPGGATWSPCGEPGEEPQAEGMTADAARGVLFVAQEDVGIWRVAVDATGFTAAPVVVDRVREFGVPATYDGTTEECVVSGPDPGVGGHLAADAEGLTIYRGVGERGYLLASSQGDDTFHAYDRRGLGGWLGAVAVGDGVVDGVQASDGAAVTNVDLGGAFRSGMLVVHDGENTPETPGADGEARPDTNFKLVPWDRVAAGFTPALRVDPVRVPGTAAAARPSVRFATFNASLNRGAEGQLQSDLATGDNAQAKAVAEVVQRVRPDVLLVNEFDHDPGGVALRRFADNYLAVGQNGAAPIRYPYRYAAPSNTGVPTGFDLDNNGVVGGGNDAFGFGAYPGQFGMAVYSRYPIDLAEVRTFRTFLWKDMPGALLPDDPATAAPADWYSPDELAVLRLSSKSHWDLPVRTPDGVVHLLASHPTPPVFDGPEDRNGRRNHDEIRFWADYVTPGAAGYVYDDRGRRGGLARGERFVVAGDQNADPLDGDSVAAAADLLLRSPRVNTDGTPTSAGADEQSRLQKGANLAHRSNPSSDTADFADTAPGNLRADYVLPDARTVVTDSGVFWPHSTDPLFRLPGLFPFPTSDHRLVWVDVARAR